VAKAGELFPETTGFMIAIQDQVISRPSNNYNTHILKDPNDICGKCRTKLETIQHITGGLSALA
jgi:hypothetical protein